jgi:transcriptional regulator with XRE-family HTH domain
MATPQQFENDLRDRRNVRGWSQEELARRSAADELGDHLAERALVYNLAALRVARGLTQQDIASKMGYSQSQVSKMEASEDFDLNFGSIVRFAQAIGVRLELTLMSRDATPVDQVKHHAFCIKQLTDYLALLAVADQKIADGVAQFFNSRRWQGCIVARVGSRATMQGIVGERSSLVVMGESLRLTDRGKVNLSRQR